MPAPFARPAVRIRVVTNFGQQIPNATVTATLAGSTQNINVPWDPYWSVFTDGSLVNGQWTLQVTALGHLRQVRDVVFTGDSIETFVLAKRPLKTYFRGYVPVVYELPLMYGVGMAYGMDDDIDAIRQIPADLGLQPFSEVPLGDAIRRQRVYVFQVPNDDAVMGADFEQRVRLRQSVRAVGEVVSLERDGVSFLTHEIIVRLRPNTPASFLDQFGLERARQIQPFADTYLLRGKSSGEVLGALERMNGPHAVMWAEPNLFSTIVAHGDPMINVQPHHYLIDSFGAWTVTQGRGARIAVIDTGCLVGHEDLRNNVQDAFNFDGMQAALDVNDGHGTCTAGIAAAEYDNGLGVAGVAGRAELVPIQINANYDLSYAEAFLWAAGIPGAPMPAGAAPALDPAAAVLSVSCGIRGLAAGALSTTPFMGGLFGVLFDYLELLARDQKGCVCVFSSGNDGDDLALRWPWAAYPTNLAVGSSTTDIPAAGDPAPLTRETRVPDSNYGVELDLCAPGGSLNPFQPTTTTLAFVNAFTQMMYGDFRQTSCACPQVAGVAALILSVSPDLTARNVRRILKECAQKIGTGLVLEEYDTSNPSFSRAYGYGRVNAACSVSAALRRRTRLDLGSIITAWWRSMFGRSG